MIVTLVILLALGIAGCSKRFVRLSESEVNKTDMRHAQEVAGALILKMQASQFYPLGEEATHRMRESFTPGEQNSAWRQIHDLYGDYQSMRYVETWASRDGLNHRIYRFRGSFSDGQPEVRVVMDAQNKLAGLWIKDWKEGVE